MTVKELMETLSKQNSDSQVYILQFDIDRYGNTVGDDIITLDDVDIYTNKKGETVLDIREAQR